MKSFICREDSLAAICDRFCLVDRGLLRPGRNWKVHNGVVRISRDIASVLFFFNWQKKKERKKDNKPHEL